MRHASASHGSIGIVLALMCACADEPSAPPTEIAGCYALTVGEWSDRRGEFRVPRRFVLLDSLGSGMFEEGELLARPLPPDERMAFEVGIWEHPLPARLNVWFGHGEGGEELNFFWNGHTWVGSVTTYTDVADVVLPTAPASLRAVSCP